jgi:hypothetical protein
MTKNLLFLLFAFVILSCNEKPSSWPKDGTTLEAVYYELPLSDTSNILIQVGQTYRLTQFGDSLVKKRDTIRYTACSNKNLPSYPLSHIDMVKTYSLNASLKEYYQKEHGSLRLVGYSAGDSLVPFTAFTSPLVIIPPTGLVADSTKAVKQSWDSKEKKFKTETNTTTRVTLLKTLTLMLDGQPEEVALYQLTLTSDALVAYGNRQLLVSNAIVIQSKMLLGKTRGLLGEWSIKTRQPESTGNNPEENAKPASYLEIIVYKAI